MFDAMCGDSKLDRTSMDCVHTVNMGEMQPVREHETFSVGI
jgi:hypothetical protein